VKQKEILHLSNFRVFEEKNMFLDKKKASGNSEASQIGNKVGY